MSDEVEGHRFGGPWTEIKLRAISDYLTFYTNALKNKPSPEDPFDLWYIDAFAGSGDRESEGTALPGLIGQARLEGSARRALRIRPSFKHFIFIERDARRCRALSSVASEFSDRDVRVRQADANDELVRIFESELWTRSRRRGLQRAVVFLDPYGLAVRWSTLKLLAETRKVDVWYLFPTHGVLRQLPHDHSALDITKRVALNELFGTPDWEAEFYQSLEKPTDLFGFAQQREDGRIATAASVEAFARRRLSTLFTFVSDPIPLLTRRKLPEFSLFCVSGNPSKPAIDLIRKGVQAQVSKYRPRSQSTSFAAGTR